MIGKAIWLVSHLPLWLGFCFVLCALGIVLRRESRRYLRDSELLKIVSEFREMMRKKSSGKLIPAAASALIMVCLAVAGTVGYSKLEMKSYPIIELRNAYVEQEIGDFGYKLISEGVEYNGAFCDTLGYKPPFSRSMTIRVLKFRNTGTCWDMRDMHPKYLMLTDRNGVPICPLCEENPTVKEN